MLQRHYPFAEHYLARNPYLAPPANDVYVPDYPESNLLYPLRNDVQMFKLSGPPRRVTAACGLGIYRDDLLGDRFYGNAFVCEPVNLLVHRLVLEPRGVTFSGRRAPEEAAAEFLAGTDTWFRPVQARTGPDGALWVVDMYRLVIEHPQWIPPEDLAKLDVRAGHTSGRIYRVFPKNHGPRPMVRLDRLDTAGLVAALDSSNGPQRDLAQQMLLWKRDISAGPLLEKLAIAHNRPQTRIQALCTLEGLELVRVPVLVRALEDEHAGVRRQAVRLAEKWAARSPEVATALLRRIDDPDPQVCLQLACSLGEWDDLRAGRALAVLARKHREDSSLLAGVASSLNKTNLGAVVTEVLAGDRTAGGPPLAGTLLGLALAYEDTASLARLLEVVAPPGDRASTAWQLAAVAEMLESVDRRGAAAALDRSRIQGLDAVLTRARALVTAPGTDEAVRLAALSLLGRQRQHRQKDIETLGEQLVPQNSFALQGAALAALGRINDERVPQLLAARLSGLSPSLRSQAIDVLLSRHAWLREWLTHLGGDPRAAAEVDARHRQLLLEHRDASIRALAARAWSEATSADRKKVVQDHRAVLGMAGSPSRGKRVFGERCAACHRLEGVGYEVGPDLTSVATKSAEALLIAILDPNQAVDERYVQYMASTKDGRVFSGILAAETGTSLTLKDQQGKMAVILRSELEELHGTGKSLMPEGLEKDVGKQDLADVIAYLRARGGDGGR
jgi:putative heme-binding domain-containing protein